MSVLFHNLEKRIKEDICWKSYLYFFVSALLCVSTIPATKVNAKVNTASYEPMSIEYVINQVGTTVYIGDLAIINIDGTVTRDAKKKYHRYMIFMFIQ